MPKIRILLGYGILIALLPAAVFGTFFPSNEYRAMGIEAIDCDGPVSVMFFALPALAVYGVAFAIFISGFRKRRPLFLGLLCGLISLGLLWNISQALLEGAQNNLEAVCGNSIQGSQYGRIG
jgi:hypothetical protein